MKFKTEPYKHQLEIFEQTKDLESYALHLEMGTGKSKIAIDTTAHLYLEDKIDGMLLVAPNGVHRNWVTDELPAHCPVEYDAHIYTSAKAKTKKHRNAVECIINSDKLAVLAVSYSAFISQTTKDAVWKFLKTRRCIYVLDESHQIKSPSAKRTKAVVASGKYAPYRRTLTGTPYLNSPFDLFSQFRFLDPDFWKDRGFPNLSCFKSHFSITKQMSFGGNSFAKVVAYRNEDQLREMLDPHRSRLTAEEVLPNLPERTYVKVPVELTSEQRKLYDAIKSDFLEDFARFKSESKTLGDAVDPPPDALTVLLRLQQVVCGYYPDEEGNLLAISEKNPRLDAAEEICNATTHPVLVWARFRKDVDLLVERLGEDRAARYDGSLGDDDKARSLERFRSGDVQVLVLNAQAGGTGLTLNEARTTVYYSNDFSLGNRLQSEKRNHRAGQRNAVTYYDLVAEKTIDEQLLGAIKDKIDAAATVNGDELSKWLDF